jgi:hypothetical protein
MDQGSDTSAHWDRRLSSRPPISFPPLSEDRLCATLCPSSVLSVTQTPTPLRPSGHVRNNTPSRPNIFTHAPSAAPA